MKWIIICVIFFITVAFSTEEIKYFPEGQFELDAEIDRNDIQWFSYYLSLMQEPSLWEISKKSKDEIYRFLLLRSSKNTVCVRVEIRQSGGASVYIKMLQYKGGGYNTYKEKLIIDESKSVSKNDLMTLITELDKTKFWEIKPSDYPAVKILESGAMVGISGGSTWVFEGIKNSKYQAFSVPNPTDHYFRADTMVELGKTFLEIADFKVDPLL
jgi:hypothetical protein